MSADGYYWARDVDGNTFIVLLEDGAWYCCGVIGPISFDPDQIIGPAPRLDH